jgi:predicted Rossmann-fold nucleotide-binding protein
MHHEHPRVSRRYVTPESGDGVVREIISSGSEPVVRIEFDLERSFRNLIAGSEQHLIFAARSRIARLGIDVIPTGPIQIQGDHAILEARVRTAVAGYGLGPVLGSLIQPGLRMGRIVHCPPESQLSSDEIHDLVKRHAIQLPSDYSLDASGTLTIRTHRLKYEFSRHLRKKDLVQILSSADGKRLLNRLQIPHRVDDVEIDPGDGVITSCSMFLHEHYVVLDRGSVTLGEHLQAIVLDPVSTRGTRVFLEFANCSERKIVNPYVTAKVYRARAALPGISRVEAGHSPTQGDAGPELDYTDVAATFDKLEEGGPEDLYLHRLVAAFPPGSPIHAAVTPLANWSRPTRLTPEEVASISPRSEGRTGIQHEYGTSILTDLPEGARATLLLGYFPNLFEHLDICQAARAGTVSRLVFRRASYEHGSFFSANDQSRLADYEALGLDVRWCNDEREHMAVHVFRGLRGFFMEPHCVEKFRRSLIIAIYGSAKALEPSEEERLDELLQHLHRMFGDNLSFLTGGGPGAMQFATDCAHRLGLLAGANYIETVDQETNKQSDYYQAFQDVSRHNRQRWFEVASFQLFCVGGVGTLEEIGMTLTDMKLGVIEPAPLVFFGAADDGPYWDPLRLQLERIVECGRGPGWLYDNVLMTSDAAKVPSFYKRVLQLG